MPHKCQSSRFLKCTLFVLQCRIFSIKMDKCLSLNTSTVSLVIYCIRFCVTIYSAFVNMCTCVILWMKWRTIHVVCHHLGAFQVSPECSLAADGQATAVQQRHRHDCQTHDETSQHSAYYSCNVRTENRHISRWDTKNSWMKQICDRNTGSYARSLGVPPVEGDTDLSAVRRASRQSLSDGPVHLEKEVWLINQ